MIKRQATSNCKTSQIRRGRNCIYYQSCMLAVAYGTTVAVFMINSCITILRCFVANKSRRSTVLSTLMQCFIQSCNLGGPGRTPNVDTKFLTTFFILISPISSQASHSILPSSLSSSPVPTSRPAHTNATKA
jgi:hypothetical protein